MKEHGKDDLQFCDVINTTKFINDGLEHSIALLKINPQYKSQADTFDLILHSWLHLVFLLLSIARDHDERREIYHLVSHMKEINPRTQNNNSVLHLAVSVNSPVTSNSFLDDESIEIFPNRDVVKFLLECGHSVIVRNTAWETPLHVATKKKNYSSTITELLLNAGASLCARDSFGITSMDQLKIQLSKVNLMRHLSLKCLAVNVMRRFNLNLNIGDVPHHCLQYYNEQV